MKLKHKLILKKSDTIVIIIILLFICIFIQIKLLEKKARFLMKTFVTSEIININNKVISRAIDSIANSIELSELIIISMNNNKEIISVDFNNSVVNKLLVKVNNNIINDVQNIQNNNLEKVGIDTFLENDGYYYNIPYGIISNNLFFNRLGYKIPIKISLIGNISSNLKCDLNEYGLNNVLIKIYIKSQIKQNIAGPFISDKVSISNEIPIITKLINGRIPTVYGGNTSIVSPINE